MLFMGIFKNIAKILLADFVKDIGKEILTKKDINTKKDFQNILLKQLDKNNKKTQTKTKKFIVSKKIILDSIKIIKDQILKKNIPKELKTKLLQELNDISDIIKVKSFSNTTYKKIAKILSDFKKNFLENNDFSKNKLELYLTNLHNLNIFLSQSDKNIKFNFSIRKTKEFKKISKFLRDYKKLKIYLNHKNELSFSNKKINTKHITFLKEYINDIEEIKLNEPITKNHINEHLKTTSLIRKLIVQQEQHILKASSNNKSYLKNDSIDFSHLQNFINAKYSLNKPSNIKFQKNVYSKSQLSFENNIIFQIKKNLPNINKEVTIKLHPPELGKIKILLSMNNNELHGKITTENNIVKDAILNNLQLLNQALKEKGINLSNFQVFVSGEFAENKENHKRWNHKREKFNNFAKELLSEDDKLQYVNLLELLENNFNLKV